MRVVQTPDAPAPGGHYSQAMVEAAGSSMDQVRDPHFGYVIEIQAIAAISVEEST